MVWRNSRTRSEANCHRDPWWKAGADFVNVTRTNGARKMFVGGERERIATQQGMPMTELRTNEALLRALENAASRKPSLSQIDKQRLSFVMGSLPEDNKMTREQVQSVLERQEGRKLSAA